MDPAGDNGPVQFADTDRGSYATLQQIPKSRVGPVPEKTESLRLPLSRGPHRLAESAETPRKQFRFVPILLIRQKGDSPVSVPEQEVHRQLHPRIAVRTDAVNIVAMASRTVQPDQRQILQFAPPVVEFRLQGQGDRPDNGPAAEQLHISDVHQFGPHPPPPQRNQQLLQDTADVAGHAVVAENEGHRAAAVSGFHPVAHAPHGLENQLPGLRMHAGIIVQYP